MRIRKWIAVMVCVSVTAAGVIYGVSAKVKSNNRTAAVSDSTQIGESRYAYQVSDAPVTTAVPASDQVLLDEGLSDERDAEVDAMYDEEPCDFIYESDETAMKGYDMDDFKITEISDEIFARIKGKSYPEGCTLDLDELRYVQVLHYGFDGEVHTGELIVNRRIAEDTLEIFKELFAIEYPIEKIRLIDEYDADDERSMEDNNSSAFNYRYIAETTTLSNHAKGFAIDINTLYNPYVYVRSDGSNFLQPVNAGDYVDREKYNPYYIRKGDPCYEIFIAHGFTWGGDWKTKKDYQHFEWSEP